MSKSPKRARRVADLVRREVARAIEKELKDPRLKQISITHVEVTPDLGTARIYFSLFSEVDMAEIEKALHKANGFFRHCLAENTELRYVPRLLFLFDSNLMRAEGLTALIDRLEITPDSELEYYSKHSSDHDADK